MTSTTALTLQGPRDAVPCGVACPWCYIENCLLTDAVYGPSAVELLWPRLRRYFE